MRYHTGILEPGVHWRLDPEGYQDGRLLAWEERLHSVPALHEADLVISDNLTGVLTIRADAVLMGSFLWSDKLMHAYPDDPNVQAFARHERHLLALHRPPMLCVGDVAMPGILRRTEFVLLPWMCQPQPGRYEDATERQHRIALLGGATGVLDAMLLRVAEHLAAHREWTLLLPEELLDRAPEAVRVRAEPFTFDEGAYASCDAVVCRPGIGTVTDCIRNGVPMVVLYEAENIEMRHVARRLADQDVACNAGPDPSGSAIVQAIESVLTGTSAARIRARLAHLERGGVDQAADWLIAYEAQDRRHVLYKAMAQETPRTTSNGNSVAWLCVRPDTSLKELLVRQERATDLGLPAGIALVVDEEGVLQGTVTDGDVRRAVLRSASLEVQARDVMQADPIAFPEGTSFQGILRCLPDELERRGRRSRRFLGKIVLVDGQRRPTRVLDYHQLWEQRVATHRHVVAVGLGYVGLTLALVLAEEGFRVTGVDVDAQKVERLGRGESHVHELGLPELLREQLRSNFAVSTSMPDDGDVYVVAVGTPVKLMGREVPEPDLEMLRRAAEMVGQHLRPGSLVILRSTVPIGSTRRVVLPVLEAASGLQGGTDFHVAFAPERTAEGKALQELRQLPQIVGGLNEDSVEATAALFRELTPAIVRVESLEAAEMAKLLNNSFRDLIFAFANEATRIAAPFNIDVVETIRAANRGYPRDPIPLPSPGVGGPCLTKDPYIFAAGRDESGLAESLSVHGRRVNEAMHAWVAEAVLDRLVALGKEPAQSTILICGLAFKGRPETGDLRASPSIAIAKRLAEHIGRIYGHDPVASAEAIRAEGLEPAELPDAFADADAVLFLNNHVAYERVDVFSMARMLRAPGIVYDGWHLFRPEEILGAAPCVYMGPGFIRASVGDGVQEEPR